MALDEFIAATHLTMTAVRTNLNPHMSLNENWAKTARHWNCTLVDGVRKMEVPFSQGQAYTEPPTLRDVLYSLAIDARAVNGSRTFEQWCFECDYSSDSRRAEAIYIATKEQNSRLKELLGEAGYNALLAIEEE